MYVRKYVCLHVCMSVCLRASQRIKFKCTHMHVRRRLSKDPIFGFIYHMIDAFAHNNAIVPLKISNSGACVGGGGGGGGGDGGRASGCLNSLSVGCAHFAHWIFEWCDVFLPECSLAKKKNDLKIQRKCVFLAKKMHINEMNTCDWLVACFFRGVPYHANI